MTNSHNSGITIRKKRKKTLPRRLSKRQQFSKGFNRYRQKKLNYGRKAFIRRVEYRNMLWERAPLFFIVCTALFASLFFLIDITNFKLEAYPILAIPLLLLAITLSLLEIWYVGGDKVSKRVGRKIRRKRQEGNLRKEK